MSTASNKAKARQHEHRIARGYREIGFEDAEREGKRAKSLDVVEGPAPIECKKRDKLSLPTEVRKIAGVHGDEWILHYEYGDRRDTSVPNVVVIPEDWWFKIMEELYEQERRTRSD